MNAQSRKSIQGKGVFVKILAISLVVILGMNFTFLIQRKISASFFWLVIAFCAAMAWWGIPYLKHKK